MQEIESSTAIILLKNKEALSKHDVSHLTCCRYDVRISPTSCDSHLRCKPRFHIDDSQSELKVTCTLFASKKIRAKSTQQSNLNRTIHSNPTEELYAVTNFIVYDRHYNRKMNSTQSDSKVDSKGTGTSFLNFIVEVQWYVCLKEQIYQQIVSSDVRPTVRDVKANGENSQAVQNKEVSLMPNAVIEPETYIALSDNAVALPSFASTGSSKYLINDATSVIRVECPCLAIEVSSFQPPVFQSLDHRTEVDEVIVLRTLPDVAATTTASPETWDKARAVDGNKVDESAFQESKKLLYTVIEGHSPMEEVRKGSYSKRSVHILWVRLVAVVLVFLWGINYLCMTMSIELQYGGLYLLLATTSTTHSTSDVGLSVQHYHDTSAFDSLGTNKLHHLYELPPQLNTTAIATNEILIFEIPRLETVGQLAGPSNTKSFVAIASLNLNQPVTTAVFLSMDGIMKSNNRPQFSNTTVTVESFESSAAVASIAQDTTLLSTSTIETTNLPGSSCIVSGDEELILASESVNVTTNVVPTTTVTVTMVPSRAYLIARVGLAKDFLATMKGAVLLSFQRFSRTWHKGGNVPIKAFIEDVANKCVNHLSAMYRRIFRRL
eukprot:gene26359-34996_t